MSVGSVSGLGNSSAVQEALETLAQTKAEAANGDQQAQQKLAAQQATSANVVATPARPVALPAGKGSTVDIQA